MKVLNSYSNAKLELEILKKRLDLIFEYEKQLNKEKKSLEETISFLENYLNKIKKDYKNLTGIENKLYYEIVINGTNVTKAIELISYEEDKDVSTLWKNYYPKIKKQVDELLLSQSNYELKKEEKNEKN